MLPILRRKLDVFFGDTTFIYDLALLVCDRNDDHQMLLNSDYPTYTAFATSTAQPALPMTFSVELPIRNFCTPVFP